MATASLYLPALYRLTPSLKAFCASPANDRAGNMKKMASDARQKSSPVNLKDIRKFSACGRHCPIAAGGARAELHGLDNRAEKAYLI
jgi:hypothetical protein